MPLGWPEQPKKKPTRRQYGLYWKWRNYLRDSKLTEAEIERRAREFAEQGREVPND